MPQPKRAPKHHFKVTLAAASTNPLGLLVQFKERKKGRLIECRVFGPLIDQGQENPTRPLLGKGEAHCHATDQPSQVKGRRLALSRALNDVEAAVFVTKEEKALFFYRLEKSEQPTLYTPGVGFYNGLKRDILKASALLLRRGYAHTLSAEASGWAQLEVLHQALDAHAVLDDAFNLRQQPQPGLNGQNDGANGAES